MFYILSDTEVALNEILVACQQSIDYYEDTLTGIRDEKSIRTINNILEQRKQFSTDLEEIILDLGSLPSAPDPDKETGELIIEKVAASLSENDTNYIIANRIEAEKHILSLLDLTKNSDLKEPHQRVLDNLTTQVKQTIKELTALL